MDSTNKLFSEQELAGHNETTYLTAAATDKKRSQGRMRHFFLDLSTPFKSGVGRSSTYASPASSLPSSASTSKLHFGASATKEKPPSAPSESKVWQDVQDDQQTPRPKSSPSKTPPRRTKALLQSSIKTTPLGSPRIFHRRRSSSGGAPLSSSSLRTLQQAHPSASAELRPSPSSPRSPRPLPTFQTLEEPVTDAFPFPNMLVSTAPGAPSSTHRFDPPFRRTPSPKGDNSLQLLGLESPINTPQAQPMSSSRTSRSPQGPIARRSGSAAVARRISAAFLSLTSSASSASESTDSESGWQVTGVPIVSYPPSLRPLPRTPPPPTSPPRPRADTPESTLNERLRTLQTLTRLEKKVKPATRDSSCGAGGESPYLVSCFSDWTTSPSAANSTSSFSRSFDSLVPSPGHASISSRQVLRRSRSRSEPLRLSTTSGRRSEYEADIEENDMYSSDDFGDDDDEDDDTNEGLLFSLSKRMVSCATQTDRPPPAPSECPSTPSSPIIDASSDTSGPPPPRPLLAIVAAGKSSGGSSNTSGGSTSTAATSVQGPRSPLALEKEKSE